jgi:hypothetical protein
MVNGNWLWFAYGTGFIAGGYTVFAIGLFVHMVRERRRPTCVR